jgi:hypothetical protein
MLSNPIMKIGQVQCSTMLDCVGLPASGGKTEDFEVLEECVCMPVTAPNTTSSIFIGKSEGTNILC